MGILFEVYLWLIFYNSHVPTIAKRFHTIFTLIFLNPANFNPFVSDDFDNLLGWISFLEKPFFLEKKQCFILLNSLNFFELIKLNNDYKSLGYSTVEIKSHIHRIVSFPVYLSVMTLLSSIIMFNVKRDMAIIFHIIIGIFLSVIIYYFYFLFNLLGQNGTIPLYTSIWLPLVLLIIFIIIGLIRINEK